MDPTILTIAATGITVTGIIAYAGYRSECLHYETWLKQSPQERCHKQCRNSFPFNGEDSYLIKCISKCYKTPETSPSQVTRDLQPNPSQPQSNN
jgi:hypothetical protein